MLRALAIVLAATITPHAALATGTPIPPAPSHWVTDTAGMMSEATRETLDQRLGQFEQRSGHQFVIWIGRTTGGVPIDDWAVRAFEAWRIGRRSLDDGVAMFVFAQDRTLRIEVGYGVESVLTDAQAWRITHETAIPRLRTGDADGAITASADRVMAALGGEASVQGHEQARLTARDIVRLIVLGLFGLAFLVLLITHPGLAMFLLANLFSRGSGRDGPGGGGGGFSGGGGRSGGGGAGGSW